MRGRERQREREAETSVPNGKGKIRISLCVCLAEWTDGLYASQSLAGWIAAGFPGGGRQSVCQYD